MSDYYPDPFKILTLGQLATPTGYAMVFNSLPPVMIVAGLAIGYARQRQLGSALRTLMMAAVLFLVAAGLTATYANRFTVSYKHDVGCLDAPPEGFVTLVPLFSPAADWPYLPGGKKYDDVANCQAFDELMWRDAASGMIATLALIALGLALTSFLLGVVFSFAASPFMRRGNS